MQRLLVVEDSHTVLQILRHLVQSRMKDVDVIFAQSLSEMKQEFCRNPEFYAAIVDLSLPDAPNGEVVDFTLKQGLPTIVLTGNFSETRRKQLIDAGVVDYVVKESRYAYYYAMKLARRLRSNHLIKIMVVDDSKTSRRYLRQLLERHLYKVIEAQDGVEALEQLGIHPDVRLVVTDFEMPNMDGFKLVNEIRRNFDKRGLGIIGLSSVESGILSAQFIKHGANEFISKPFYPEEFYCRITQNLEAMELIEKIEDTANRDYLTGLYNRRAFFQRAAVLLDEAHRQQQPLSFAILDLDHFKQINDRYGHACGDEVLKRFALLLDLHCQQALYARIGGEEFAILMVGLTNEQAVSLVDELRKRLVGEVIHWQEQELCASFSAGVITELNADIDHLYHQADDMLYRAKEAGRNTVFGNEVDD